MPRSQPAQPARPGLCDTIRLAPGGVNTGIFLNDGIQFFPKVCADNSVAVRIQVQKSTRAVLQIRKADGRIVERELPR